MEKLSHELSKHYPAVKLYIDDIGRILDELESAGLKYELSTYHYKYDNLKRLVTEERKINSISIYSPNPRISLSFSNDTAYVVISNDDNFSTGLFHKLDAIINPRRRFVYFKYIFFSPLIITILIFWLFPKTNIWYIIELGILAFVFIYGLMFTYALDKKRSVICNRNSYEKSNFFQGTGKDIILALIFAIIAGGLIEIGKILFNTHFK